MAKKFGKKMSAEERKEFKGGKYMGGPAEEKSEKKKGKRMAVGGLGMDDSAGTAAARPAPMPTPGMARPGVRMGQRPGMPGVRAGQTRRTPASPGLAKPMPMPAPSAQPGAARPAVRGPATVNYNNLTPTANPAPTPASPSVEPPMAVGPGAPRGTRPSAPTSTGAGAVGATLNYDPSFANNYNGTPIAMKRGGLVGKKKEAKTFKKGGKVKGMKAEPRPASTIDRNLGLGLNPPRPVTTNPGMGLGLKGGGLARKGVGQALAKGGIVKGAGAASRGVKKPRYC